MRPAYAMWSPDKGVLVTHSILTGPPLGPRRAGWCNLLYRQMHMATASGVVMRYYVKFDPAEDASEVV